MPPQFVRITEIFYSLQGETSTAGLPTTFIRLTGCPLRCTYCDTEYAFHGGERMSLDAVIDKAVEFGSPWVTVTGGEPLAQRTCLDLLSRLCDRGFNVSLETSGALPIEEVDPRVAVILDIKTPGSGEVARNLYSNLQFLKTQDEVKFVLSDRQDYDWARMKMDEHKLVDSGAGVIFSPVHSSLDATTLADWIVADRLQVRFQVQLHKLLWNDEPGR